MRTVFFASIFSIVFLGCHAIYTAWKLTTHRHSFILLAEYDYEHGIYISHGMELIIYYTRINKLYRNIYPCAAGTERIVYCQRLGLP